MIEVSIKFPKLTLKFDNVQTEASLLADRLQKTMIAQFQVSLLAKRKKVTGQTLTRIKAGAAVSGGGVHNRQVIADKSLHFIDKGRRKGAKMPVHLVGTGVRGGKVFEPLPRMLQWFNALGIPRSAWFPILRSISLKGIPPNNIRQDAIRRANPIIRKEARLTGARISRGLVVYAA